MDANRNKHLKRSLDRETFAPCPAAKRGKSMRSRLYLSPGEEAKRVSISSTKSVTGHMIGPPERQAYG